MLPQDRKLVVKRGLCFFRTENWLSCKKRNVFPHLNHQGACQYAPQGVYHITPPHNVPMHQHRSSLPFCFSWVVVVDLWVGEEGCPLGRWGGDHGGLLTWVETLPARPASGPAAGPSRGCLLYTSPSPRDISLSRMPSSA